MKRKAEQDAPIFSQTDRAGQPPCKRLKTRPIDTGDSSPQDSAIVCPTPKDAISEEYNILADDVEAHARKRTADEDASISSKTHQTPRKRLKIGPIDTSDSSPQDSTVVSPTPKEAIAEEYEILPDEEPAPYTRASTPVLDYYDPDFGSKVCEAFSVRQQVSEIQQIWREDKYGVVITRAYSPGNTPDSAREDYNARQDAAIRAFEDGLTMSSDEDVGDHTSTATTASGSKETGVNKILHKHSAESRNKISKSLHVSRSDRMALRALRRKRTARIHALR
ncbi:hypothetical protein LTR37_008950 [Vermiconidia calcicola]|uniref:Uncharacterized protein n=1 Tax=Vermiconidia calcicola TaxID=1690605 RepID=A0ACC3N982_9PEZI|nr:hypothetical protein LTR37_008950 [Vermiconidia calcicola]